MKLNYIFVLVLLMAGCAKKQEGYTITGNFLKGNYNGYIYLSTPHTKDSCLVQNNRFSFNGKTDFPIQGWLTINGNDKLTFFYVENSQITLTLNAPTDLKVTSVTGSKSYVKQQHFQSFLDNNYTNANFNSVVKDSLTQFITRNPAHSLSGKFLATIASESWILSAEEVTHYKQMLDTTKQTGTDLFVINQAIKKLTKFGIGSTFKEFDLYNTQNQTESTASVNANVLLVDFWASWCVPCRKQNPDWVKVYQKYHKKGFDALSISIQEETEPWLQAITKDNLTWHHLRSGEEFDSPVVLYYEFYSIPYNIVLDKNRKVIAVDITPNKLEYLINQNQ